MKWSLFNALKNNNNWSRNQTSTGPLNDRQVVIGSAYHSTRIFPVFSNMSRTFAGSAPRGAALKLKSNMAEVKMGGQ